MKIRVGLLGYYGRENLGDEAVLAGTLACLKELAPEAEPVVFSYDPPRTEELHRVAVRQMKTVNSPAIALRLREVDCLVVGGGGLLNDYRLSGLVFHAHWVAAARLLRRPVMLHAVGVGPLRTRAGRRLAGWMARSCRCVSVRDEMSRELLGFPGAILGADAALLMEPPGVAPRRERTALIVPRSWPGGCPTSALAALADWLAGQGMEPRIVAMQPQRDEGEAEDVARRATCGARALAAPQGPREAAALFGSAGLVVSMRLHGVLFAAMGGAPAIGIAYDEKVTVLLEELGCREQCVPLEGLTEAALIAKAQETLRSREEVSARVTVGCARLKARAQQAGELLAGFVKGVASRAR